MIRIRTIDDINGEPIEIEIDDGLPDPGELIEAQQAALLLRSIAEAEIIMPPYEHKYKRKKKVDNHSSV